jgi:hypothetical protein
MKRFALVPALAALATLGANAAITVDLSSAQSDIESAGQSLVGIAVVVLGIALVYGFIRKRG